MIYCDKDGIVPVPEEDLPVVLPEVEEFRPTGTGTSASSWTTRIICMACSP